MSDRNRERAEEILRGEPFLKGARDGFIEALAERGAFAVLPAGAPVVRKGDPFGAYLCVVSGRVAMSLHLGGERRVEVDELREGARFGEACFYEDPNADFDYEVMDETALFSLSRHDVIEVLKESPEDAEWVRRQGRVRPVYQFLLGLPIFQALTKDRLFELAARVEKRPVEAGEVLIKEDTAGDSLFIVQRGAFQVYREKENNRLLATLTAGAIVGEMALVKDAARNASVRAVEDSIVYRLEKGDFSDLLAGQDAWRRELMKLADERQRASRAVKEATPEISPRTAAREAPRGERPPKKSRRLSARRPRMVWQQGKNDSGAACLAMICGWHGPTIGLNLPKELLQAGSADASLTGMIRAARELGLNVEAHKADWSLLTAGVLPAVANFDGYRWVVVYRAHRSGALVADPAKGLVRMTREEFERRWTRFTLFLEPSARFADLKDSARGFSRFLPHVRPHKRHLKEIALASLSIKFLAVFLPLLNMHVIDNVLMKGDGRFFVPSIVLVSALTALQLTTVYFRQNLSMYVSRRVSLSLFSSFYRRMFSLPISYFEARSVGEISARIDQNGAITEFMTNTGIETFLDFLTAMLVSAIFFILSPALTFITFAFILLDIVQVYFVSPRLQRNFRAAFHKMAEVQGHFIESLNGMATIKTLGVGSQIRWKLENLYTDLKNEQLKGEMISAGMQVGTGFISSLSGAALLFAGAYMTFAGEMTVGALIAFLSMVNYVRNPVVNIVRSWDNFQETLNAIDRVNDIYDSRPEMEEEDRESLMELPPLMGNVEFSNVVFRYDVDAGWNVLNDVRLKIAAGEKVAFVGKSGSGKSTVIKLLFGFYQPTSGKVFVDGFNLKDCWLPSLRGQVGAALQRDFLFDGTIRENIARGRPSASFTDIVEAARLAAAHDFIMGLPQGYETRILGESGNLSGGQRQRVCLARTFLQDPKILILDESTSALDNESERFVMDNLFRRFHDRTVVMIAHRLHTVRPCDRIYVLDRGEIVESGSYDALMERQGVFYALNAKQGT